MTNPPSPYQALGRGVPRRLGRQEVFDRIVRKLRSGQHVSIVAPPYMGKSVLVRAIADHFREPGRDEFHAVAELDLRLRPPTGDEEFRERLAEALIRGLAEQNPIAVEMLQDREDSLVSRLRMLFGILRDERKRVLIVLDSIDPLLLSADISRHVWDNLLDLGQLPSVTYVTASQQRLNALAFLPESRTSNFFGLFGASPEILGPFEWSEYRSLVQPLSEVRAVRFAESGLNEIKIQTGGLPLPLMAFLEHLWDEESAVEALPSEIVRGLFVEFQRRTRIADPLWERCSEDEKSVLVDLAEGPARPEAEIKRAVLLSLESRGFVTRDRTGVRLAAETIRRVALERQDDVSAFRRLFGDQERWEQSFPALLQLRLQQLHIGDQKTRDFLDRIVAEAASPHNCFGRIRVLASHLIFDAVRRLAPDGVVPEDWTRALQFKRARDPHAGPLPADASSRLKLLRDVILNDLVAPEKLSRTQFELLSFLYHLGNFGQHQEGADVAPGSAHVACLAALELIAQMGEE